MMQGTRQIRSSNMKPQSRSPPLAEHAIVAGLSTETFGSSVWPKLIIAQGAIVRPREAEKSILFLMETLVLLEQLGWAPLTMALSASHHHGTTSDTLR
jgi:hypothetical protein